MNALRLIFLVLLVVFAVMYGSFMRNLLDASWLLFGLIAIGFPLGLAWIVGDEADREDFYKIKDWIVKTWWRFRR